MDLVLYAIPFFLLSIIIEVCWDRYKGTAYYRINDTINSLSMGIISTTRKLLIVGIGGMVFSWIQQHLSIETWATTSWLGYAIAFVLYDLCYYWFHRISHERKIFWAAHVAHHQSEEYNLSTALRQTSMSFLLSWVFYIPCFMLGMPAEVFVTVASANLIYQFWVHTRFIPELGPLEYLLITPSNHRVHHARNPEYIDKNYGGVFILWDRAFGTYKRENKSLPPDYGITRGLNSWNPLWANVHLYISMLKDALKTPHWKDKFHIFVGTTGYIAPGINKGTVVPGNHFDPTIPAAVKFYALAQFIVSNIVGVALIYASGQLDSISNTVLFVYLLTSLISIGWLLEGRAPILEWVRIIITIPLVIALLGRPDYFEWIIVYVGLSIIALVWLQKSTKPTSAAPV
ncbi:MAG: sterol desaturase family protein [Pseudomonadales bacterium]